MSWAMRRRILYAIGVFLFLLIVIGGPIAYKIFTIPPTCHDGIQNQGETSIDRGGPCLLLDASTLQPTGILWARTFKVRDGLYDAVAYIDNPNQDAAAMSVSYTLTIYDNQNVLVAEAHGTAFIMPGGPTPIFVGSIDTGNRDAIHAQLTFDNAPIWEKASNVARAISVQNVTPTQDADSARISAYAQNNSTLPITNITFVATVFDPSGNAIASSQTALPKLEAGASQSIFFTWPAPFSSQIGRIDVIPVVQPLPDDSAEQ